MKCLLFHTAPPTTKHSVKICFLPFHEAFDSFCISKIVLLETTQECIPGWPPGMRSWKTSRNTLLERFWEPTLVLSLNVRYLYIEINANVTLLSILWWWITFSNFFGMGGGVKCLLFHTVPPIKKHYVKKIFSPFHEASDSFSFIKNRVPGNNPGMHSWMYSRNALLADLQEHAPGQALGTYTPWMLGIHTLELMQM